MNFNHVAKSAIALLVSVTGILGFPPRVSAKSKEKVLYSFQGGSDGARPAGSVIFGKNGNLYGATTNGGSSSCRGPFQCGTVYQLKPPAKQGDPWTETVLYVFKGSDSNDGASPFGGLIWDQAGTLYGTTGYDGTGNCMLFGSRVGCGTVFQLRPPTTPGALWTETVIYNFQGGKDGQFPMGDLVFDSAGNLYGATFYGGGFGSCNDPFFRHCGTVFELSPPKSKGEVWKEKVLYSFKSSKDGANPNGGLIFDKKGVLYGTTYWGGGTLSCKGNDGVGCGVVFMLKPPTKDGAWTEKILHRFDRSSGDGGNPTDGLKLDSEGIIYGATIAGGGRTGEGTIFKLVRPAKRGNHWAETLVHIFGMDNDGWNPVAAPTFGANDTLYGTTCCGGKLGDGTIFTLSPRLEEDNGSTYTVLYDFSPPPDGFFPAAGLVFDQAGDLYSTTQLGGTGPCPGGGCGTVFSVAP